MDPGLEEAIATILWASPRLLTDVQELREVSILILINQIWCVQMYVTVATPVHCNF